MDDRTGSLKEVVNILMGSGMPGADNDAAMKALEQMKLDNPNGLLFPGGEAQVCCLRRLCNTAYMGKGDTQQPKVRPDPCLLDLRGGRCRGRMIRDAAAA